MPPIAGFMGFSIPEVQGVPDAFGPKGVAEGAVIFQEDVFFADYQDDLEGFEPGDQVGIGEIGDELSGHIVIDVLIAIAFEEIVEKFHGSGEVVASAEADHLVKVPGMLEGKVSRMVGPERASGGCDRRMRVDKTDKTEHIGQNIAFIFQVAADAFGGGDIFSVKTFFVDAVETIDLYAPGFDLLVKRIDDLPILIVIKTGGAGGEKEYRFAGVTKDQQFHIPAEVFAKPSVVFSFHGFPVDR